MWLELQRQAQEKLRNELYSPLSAAEARGILESRKLGIASLRLLPKMSGGVHQRTNTSTLYCYICCLGPNLHPADIDSTPVQQCNRDT